MLTPKMSLRRNNILAAYGELIEDVYKGKAGHVVRASHHPRPVLTYHWYSISWYILMDICLWPRYVFVQSAYPVSESTIMTWMDCCEATTMRKKISLISAADWSKLLYQSYKCRGGKYIYFSVIKECLWTLAGVLVIAFQCQENCSGWKCYF